MEGMILKIKKIKIDPSEWTVLKMNGLMCLGSF
jgi:hypothetical protein